LARGVRRDPEGRSAGARRGRCGRVHGARTGPSRRARQPRAVLGREAAAVRGASAPRRDRRARIGLRTGRSGAGRRRAARGARGGGRELAAEEAMPGAPAERLRGRLRVGSERRDVVLPTVHGVAVTDLLVAATAVIALGGEPGAVAGAIPCVTPRPGRLETVG